MIGVIDNYDSFTYNLVQLVQSAGAPVSVFRNDQKTIPEVDAHSLSGLLISPGPGRPEQAGISVEAVHHFTGKAPILGVCLGHQAIAAAFGGSMMPAPRLIHGKRSRVFHDGRTLFKGIPNPFHAVRYHSLLVDPENIPSCLEVSAWTRHGEIMALRHRSSVVEGIQFHPESFLTEYGARIIEQFLTLVYGDLKKQEKAA
jgi:anthranilate synthase/aminodeoxychorismate synthase-like glutamine amidotransferase